MGATSIDAPQSQPPLRIVNAHLRFPRVSRIEPSSSRFVHIAAEIDKRPPFLPSSRAKQRVVAHCKERCADLRKEPGVLDASVFTALIIPPGLGEYAKQRADKLHIARFDLAVLIECESEEAMQRGATAPDLQGHGACDH